MKAPTRHELALFTRQLATLIATGMPIHSSLDVLARQYAQAPLGLPILGVRQAVDRGVGVSAAFGREAGVFDPLYVALVSAGEKQGRLDETLGELADYLERDAVLRDRVKGALAYPAFVLAVTLGLTWWIFSFVLPAFMPMFRSMEGSLPLATQVLMALVSFTRNPFLTAAAVGLLVGGTVLGARWLRTPSGRAAFDRVSLMLPVYGPLARKVVLARLARSMSTMIDSGLPILDTLQQTSRTVANAVYEEDLLAARERLKHGVSLADHFASRRDLYPAMLVQMFASGEETGRLDELMLKASQTFEADVEHAIEMFLILLEPALMAVLAVIVGFVVISVFLPLYAFLQRMG